MNNSRSSKCLTAEGRPYNSYPFLPNRLWCVITRNNLFYFQELLDFFIQISVMFDDTHLRKQLFWLTK